MVFLEYFYYYCFIKKNIMETQKEKIERMEYYIAEYYGTSMVETLKIQSGLIKRSWNQDPLGNPERDYLMLLTGAYKVYMFQTH